MAACAGDPAPEAQNPFSHCSAQGLEQGTDEFSRCVNDYVAEACAAAGHPAGSNAYGQCVEDLQKGAFVRQQLEMRGF